MNAIKVRIITSAAKGFEKVYKMSPKDTIYLYYAASSAVNAQDYETALKYYLQLKEYGLYGYTNELLCYQ